MKKPIMAIGAHIGDMELSAGGVLASMALEGHPVITVALTSGEKGHPEGVDLETYRKQKQKEARRFTDLLGGVSIVLPYDDGTLYAHDEIKFEVADLIRMHRPDALITHWKNSMHKDHEATHHIVNDAHFYAGLAGFRRKHDAHFAKGPHYAENWEDRPDFDPYLYIEVSEKGFDLWKEAIDTHAFVNASPSFEYKAYYETLMAVRGREARKTYAQAFDVSPFAKRMIKSTF